MSYKTV